MNTKNPTQDDQPANGAGMRIGGISDITNSHVNVAGGDLAQTTYNIEHAHFESPPVPQPAPHLLPYHNLPRPDYACFVGRETELAWLRSRLSPKDRSWQIAITGIGGVGKSALALAIAHEYLENYKRLPKRQRFDAIIWISAKEEVLTAQGKQKAGLPENVLHTLEDVYTAIAHTLEREDITRALPKDQGRVVEKALKAQRTLLVMDNLESVQDERIKPFLCNLPAPTKALVTSREWLDVAYIWQLKGLPAAEADQLILEETSLRQVDLEAAQRQRIYELTSGLPLPIKLAVARLSGGESFPAVERWLGDNDGDLPEYCIAGQIELVKQRDPNTWKLLLACSLFDRTAGALREALGYVADLSIADRDQGLGQLQRMFLINRSDNERFWILPIVQRYARIQFTHENNKDLVDRWLAWSVRFVRDQEDDLNHKMEHINEFATEYPNLMTAIRWCRETHRWSELFELAEGVWIFTYLRSLLQDWEEIVRAYHEGVIATQEEKRLSKAMIQFGRLFRIRGNDSLALSYTEKAAALAQTYHLENDLRECWTIQTYLYARKGDFEKAEELALKLLEASQLAGDIQNTYYAAQRLSNMASNQKQFELADKWLDLAEQAAQQLDSPRQLTGVFYRRALNYIEQRNYDPAEKLLVENIKNNLIWGIPRHVAGNQFRLAQLYFLSSRLTLARQYAQEAHQSFDRLGMTLDKEKAASLLEQIKDAEK